MVMVGLEEEELCVAVYLWNLYANAEMEAFLVVGTGGP